MNTCFPFFLYCFLHDISLLHIYIICWCLLSHTPSLIENVTRAAQGSRLRITCRTCPAFLLYTTDYWVTSYASTSLSLHILSSSFLWDIYIEMFVLMLYRRHNYIIILYYKASLSLFCFICYTLLQPLAMPACHCCSCWASFLASSQSHWWASHMLLFQTELSETLKK